MSASKRSARNTESQSKRRKAEGKEYKENNGLATLLNEETTLPAPDVAHPQTTEDPASLYVPTKSHPAAALPDAVREFSTWSHRFGELLSAAGHQAILDSEWTAWLANEVPKLQSLLREQQQTITSQDARIGELESKVQEKAASQDSKMDDLISKVHQQQQIIDDLNKEIKQQGESCRTIFDRLENIKIADVLKGFLGRSAS